jgi:uncharacterized protein YdhG (YjbR/CyaY superfamily)
MQSYNTIDQYIADFPSPIQKILTSIRSTIHKTVPKAEEAIKYGIPTFVLGGNLIHFAAFKHHIGIYPGPVGVAAFEKELSRYQTSKGAIQLPLDEPIPLNLIKKIVEFRVQQTELKAKLKSAKPKKATSKTAVPKKANEPVQELLPSIPAPARRALANEGISNLKQLSRYSANQLLELHGMGPGSIPKIEEALKAEGLNLKKSKV